MGNSDSYSPQINNNNVNSNNSSIHQSTISSSTSIPFTSICGNFESQETLKNTAKNEIVLTSTYTYPKGTYSHESIRLFSSKEKLLFYFISKNNISALRYLILNGVNINILDEDRTSPLHIACRFGSVQLVEEIINQGAMINIPDIVGWTPLHVACYSARPDVILLLLKKRANYNTKNRDKKTAKNLVEKKNPFCASIIDNFEKYEKIHMEKCLNDINSNNVLYTDVMKKFLTYQQLKGEYLSTHTEGLDTNIFEEFEEMNIKIKDGKNGKDKIEEKIINGNKSKRIQKFEKYIFDILSVKNNTHILKDCEDSSELDEVPSEFSSQENELTMKISKKKLEEIISNYKYIPKKHIFYLNYSILNGFIGIKRGKDNSHLQKQTILSINNLSSFPIPSSIKTLNETQFISENEEIYNVYSSETDDDSDSSLDSNEDESHLNEDNYSDSINEADKTISEEGNSIRTLLCSKEDEKPIIHENIYNSIIKNKQNSLELYLKKNVKIFEQIILKLFPLDYLLSLFLLISVSRIENTLVSLIKYITENFTNKRLLTIILSKNPNSNNEILNNYFKSYCTTSYSYSKCLSKILSLFDLSFNDLKLIDDVSRSFAKYYYRNENNANNDNGQIAKSESSLYYLTFSLLISSLLYKGEEDKEKVICDLIILIKNLNEGENFNKKIINDCLSTILNEKKLPILEKNNNHNTLNNKYENFSSYHLGLVLNNKFKSYYGYYNDGLLILTKDKNGEKIDKIIYIKIKEHLSFSYKGNQITLYGKEKKEKIIIIKKSRNELKYKLYDKIMIIIENEKIIEELSNYFKFC